MYIYITTFGLEGVICENCDQLNGLELVYISFSNIYMRLITTKNTSFPAKHYVQGQLLALLVNWGDHFNHCASTC